MSSLIYPEKSWVNPQINILPIIMTFRPDKDIKYKMSGVKKLYCKCCPYRKKIWNKKKKNPEKGQFWVQPNSGNLHNVIDMRLINTYIWYNIHIKENIIKIMYY